MDITTCVDTSLNLNVVPPSNHTEHVAAEVLVEELHRLSSENKKLMETLKQVCDDYVALQKHLSEFSINKQHLPSNFEKEELIIASSTPSSSSWKRKAESEIMSNKFGVTTECSTTTADNEVAVFKRPFRHDASPKVSKIIVRTDASDTTSLYVRDGYQWRKYGQKVTRDNPSPRAYFRCSFAPNCPVKKKVQRSAEDPTLLVATYEGEHNHHNAAEISLMSCSTSSTATCSSPPRHQSSTESPTLMNGIIAGATPPTTVTADLVKSGLVAQKSSSSIIMQQQQQQQQQFLVHQMATSLTQDPNFTAALATAISGTILDHASIVKTR